MLSTAILQIYDAARGGVYDPEMFMLADADTKGQIIALWNRDHAKLAKTWEDKVEAFLSDAQVGYAFLTPQLYRIETEVYMIKRPSFDVSRFMPINTEGDMWDIGTLVYSIEDVGRAKFFSAGAYDMPFASNKMSQHARNFHLAGIGYEWEMGELQRAAKLGRALQSDKAQAAVSTADRFIYGVAMTGKNADGENEKGWTGFVNNASVPQAQVAADGTGSSRLWADKTPDLILRDINEAITSVETGTGETHIANTLALPTSRYNAIATKRVTDTNGTILSFLTANNVAGEGLTILKSRALETAGTGNTTRMVAYDRDPQVLRFLLPGAHTFLSPFQKASLVYEVGGIMNVGGTDIRLPKAIVYRDSF